MRMGRRERRASAVAAVLAGALLAVPVSGQSALDVTGYAFSIRIPDTGSVITAVARISYRGAPTDGLRFDLVGLTVDSVRAVRPPAAFHL